MRFVVLALLVAVGGCASWPADVPRVVSYAIDDPDNTSLGRAFGAQAREHPGLSGFALLVSGQPALSARIALAEEAERTLDLQYFSVGDDLTSDLLLRHIVAAADRGVRVRILLDDFYATSRQFAWRAMAAHPAVQVRLFNPFYSGTASLARLGEFVFDRQRLNRRMHNKLWVTDNSAAIVGSRNLGAEYFEASHVVNFQDVDLLAVGPVVDDMSRAFDAYWNDASAVPAQALTGSPRIDDGEVERRRLLLRAAACQGQPPCGSPSEDEWGDALSAGSLPLLWGRAQFVHDRPDVEKSEVPSGIEHGWIDDRPGGIRTHDELLVVAPYLVPGRAGLEHLQQMRSRGVRVAVLTNSLAATDSPAAHAGYARHRPELLRAGVELYEMRLAPGMVHDSAHLWARATQASLHAKFIVQDRKRSIVGSLNQDPRSRLYNTESWIVVDSTDLAAQLTALFEEGTSLEHSFKVVYTAREGADRIEWLTEEDGTPVRRALEPTAESGLLLWRTILGHLIPDHLL